ncbi:hypothetical protein [Burkholderia glumae]|uniref:hypothetical protein n=1 Tax=Burkholderia glumae TaxID=337 RepID=UPI00148EA5B2|nr:hypothetical protein GAS18_28610 [Burkholderia glumae]
MPLDDEKFGKARLVRGPSAEIGIDRMHDRGLVRVEQGAQAIETRYPRRERRSGVTGKRFALALEADREIGGRLGCMVSPAEAMVSFGRRLDNADGAGCMGKRQWCFGTIVLVFGTNRRFEGFSA